MQPIDSLKGLGVEKALTGDRKEEDVLTSPEEFPMEMGCVKGLCD